VIVLEFYWLMIVRKIYKLLKVLLCMERKRLLGLGLFGLLSVFLLSSGVLAETLAEKFTGGGASDILTSLQDSQLFSRFLIFVLVALIVYAVSQALPFFEADNLKWIRGLVAVVVAILATLYLEDFEVTTIVFSYSAFGIALSAIFPFFPNKITQISMISIM